MPAGFDADGATPAPVPEGDPAGMSGRFHDGVDLTDHGTVPRHKNLSGMKHRLLNGLSVNKGPVGGIQIQHGDDTVF